MRQRSETAIGLFVAPVPFSPRIEYREAAAGSTVAALLADAVNHAGLAEEDLDLVRVYVDGEALPFATPEERLATLDLVVPAGVTVNVSVEPQGGSNNEARGALKLFYQIGAIVSQIFGSSLLSAALMVTGEVVTNALFPIVTPGGIDPARGAGSLQDTSNPIRRRGMMPLQLGPERVALDVAAKPFTRMVGDEQWLHVIFAGHYGPCSLADLKIGETLASDYPAADLKTEQFLLPGPRSFTLYPNSPNQENFNDELDVRAAAPEWDVHTAEVGAERIEVDVAWPTGLRFTKDNGTIMHHAVRVAVEWAPVGTETWTAAALEGGPFNDRTGATLPTGVYEVHLRTTDAVRRTLAFAVADPSVQIKVRMRAWHPDGNDVQKSTEATYWTALRSITSDPPILDEMLSVIALAIRSSEDLNGALPVVTAVITPHAPVWTGTEWLDDVADWEPTDNAIALARMMLVGPAAAKPMAADEIDASAQVHHALIEANGWKGAFRLTDDATQQDALRVLERIGRFRCYDNGEALCFSPDWEKPIPRQVFTGRNVQGYRYRRVFPEPVHALIVEFRNLDEDAAWDEVIVYADGYDATNAELFETLRLDWACVATRAYKEGRVALAKRQLQVESHEWTAGADSIRCAYGDRVKVRHASALYGVGEARVDRRTWSGALVSGVRLDAAVTMEAGKSYALDVRRADGVLAGVAVTTVPGTTRDLVFPAPLAAGAAPEAGDLVAFGEAGEVTEDLEVVDITFQEGDTATIQAVRYLAAEIEVAETGPIPPLVTKAKPRPAPPALRILATTGSPSGPTVTFDVDPVPAGGTLRGFSARWRRSVAAGQEPNPWSPLPMLAPRDRMVRLPAIEGAVYDPDDADSLWRVDVEIRAVLTDGQASTPPTVAADILVERPVAAPTNFTATGVTRTAPDGSKYGALFVTADPQTAGVVQDLVVEVRASGSSDPWETAGPPLPAANPRGDFRAVLGGKVYEVRGRWRTSDGWPSAWVTLTGKIVPAGSHVAGGFVGQGGLATRDGVNLGAGGHVFRDNGIDRATDALLVTGLGTAAAIAGQGALATKSAASWTADVSGRPTELTDGRVSAGLTSTGDLNRNITTTRANGSNLLRYTAGGLFTGELAADVTATHTAAAIVGQGALATLSRATRMTKAAPAGSVTLNALSVGVEAQKLFEFSHTGGGGEAILQVCFDLAGSTTPASQVFVYVDDVFTWTYNPDSGQTEVTGYEDDPRIANGAGNQTFLFDLGVLSAGSHTVRVYAARSVGAGTTTVNYRRAVVLESII